MGSHSPDTFQGGRHKTSKMGKTTGKYYVNSVSCSSSSPAPSPPPQEILAIFPKKNQHKFNTTRCVSSRSRGLKKPQSLKYVLLPLQRLTVCRKTFIMSAQSTLFAWPLIPHLNWAFNSHWFHQQKKEQNKKEKKAEMLQHA